MTTRENIELLRAQIHYYAAEEARSSAPERERAYARAMVQDLELEVTELERAAPIIA
jgi:hypothetical protein